MLLPSHAPEEIIVRIYFVALHSLTSWIPDDHVLLLISWIEQGVFQEVGPKVSGSELSYGQPMEAGLGVFEPLKILVKRGRAIDFEKSADLVEFSFSIGKEILADKGEGADFEVAEQFFA